MRSIVLILASLIMLFTSAILFSFFACQHLNMDDFYMFESTTISSGTNDTTSSSEKSIISTTTTTTTPSTTGTDTSTTTTTTTTTSTVDETNPLVTITSPSEGTAVPSSFTITGTASDNVWVDSVEISIDGNPAQPVSGTTVWTFSVVLSLGAHSIVVTAYDTNGNTNNKSINVSVTEDASPPTISITNVISTDWINDNFQLEGIASDNKEVALVEIRIDSGDYFSASGKSSWTATIAETDGWHSVFARATDMHGNVGFDSVYIRVESTIPTLFVTTPIENEQVAGIYEVTGTAEDLESGIDYIEIQVDGGAWVKATGTDNWNYSWDTSGLSLGIHEIRIRCVDKVGNISAEISRHVDKTTIATITVATNTTGNYHQRLFTNPDTGDLYLGVVELVGGIKYGYAKKWNGGSWDTVGSVELNYDNSYDVNSIPFLAFNGTEIYAAWEELTASYKQIYAKKWNGSNWEVLGTGVCSNADDARHPSIAYSVVEATPYIAYVYNDFSGCSSEHEDMRVEYWNGSDWVQVGGNVDFGSYTHIEMPFLSFRNGGNDLYVVLHYWRESCAGSNGYVAYQYWNGSSWNGGNLSGNFSGSADFYATVDHSNIGDFYCIWQRGGGIFVGEYLESGGWNQIGTNIEVDDNPNVAYDPSITYFNSKPYAAWRERTGVGSNYQTYVSSYNGSSWSWEMISPPDGWNVVANNSAVGPQTSIAYIGTKFYLSFWEYDEVTTYKLYVRYLQ